MKKKILIVLKIIICILFFSSCKGEDENSREVLFGEKVFSENKNLFYSLKNYVVSNYINDTLNKSHPRIIFTTSEKKMRDYYFDSHIDSVIKKNIFIKEMRIEKGLCNKSSFTEVKFILKEDFQSYSVSLIYDYCAGPFDYIETRNTKTKSIEDKWEVFCDN